MLKYASLDEGLNSLAIHGIYPDGVCIHPQVLEKWKEEEEERGTKKPDQEWESFQGLIFDVCPGLDQSRAYWVLEGRVVGVTVDGGKVIR